MRHSRKKSFVHTVFVSFLNFCCLPVMQFLGFAAAKTHWTFEAPGSSWPKLLKLMAGGNTCELKPTKKTTANTNRNLWWDLVDGNLDQSTRKFVSAGYDKSDLPRPQAFSVSPMLEPPEASTQRAQNILLMEEILHQLRLVGYPSIYSFIYTSQVVSRISEPSTVYQFLNFCQQSWNFQS